MDTFSREGQKGRKAHTFCNAERDLCRQQWTTVRAEITHSLQRKYTALSSARDDGKDGALTHCVTERMSLSTRDDGEDRQHPRTVLQREREIIFVRGVTVRMESTHVLGCRERILSSARDDGEDREHSHSVVQRGNVIFSQV